MKSESMDPIATLAVIGSFITSISALVLGLAGIWAQSKRDSKQAKADDDKTKAQNELDKSRLDLERDKADDEARQLTLDSLKAEIARLTEKETLDRNRIMELETAELEKISKIGELMIAKINAESEVATMKYKMEALQTKLNSILPPEESKKRKEETVPLAIRQTLETNATRIALVEEEMNKELKTFKSGSLANNGETTPVGRE